jgi:hypothetical protein
MAALLARVDSSSIGSYILFMILSLPVSIMTAVQRVPAGVVGAAG